MRAGRRTERGRRPATHKGSNVRDEEELGIGRGPGRVHVRVVRGLHAPVVRNVLPNGQVAIDVHARQGLEGAVLLDLEARTARACNPGQ